MKKILLITTSVAFVMASVFLVPMAVDAKGEAWGKCTACHSLTTTDVKIGPSLKGVIGREAGSVLGAKSDSLKKGGWKWTDENLRAWMCKSKKEIKILSGNPDATTRMPNINICDENDQKEVLTKLHSL